MLKQNLMIAALTLASTAAEARSFVVPVVRTTPVTEQIRVDKEVCREEPTTRYTRRGNDRTGTVVGAIVGGALGNQVGDGSGRTAATVAGALIGGAVGRDIDRSNNPQRRVTEYQTVCRIEPVYETVTYFDVTYRHRGRLYTERMDYHPGREMRIHR